VAIDAVDLPPGAFVAERMKPSPGYDSIAPIVRDATEAFLHLGLFAAAARRHAITSAQTRDWIGALQRASELVVTLVDERGAVAPAQFVNLLESPTDRGIVIIASFASAAAPVGAVLRPVSSKGAGGQPRAV
jgi:hypothetical protein